MRKKSPRIKGGAKRVAKVVEILEIKKICEKLREENKIIVFTNGCFDILHPGHIEVLEKAKSFGDVLIGGLNTDKSIKEFKGPVRPIFNQSDRARVLSAISYVDYIVMFDEPTPYKLIEIVKPDILVKGGDYTPDKVVGREIVGKVVIVPLLPGYSTTEVIDRIMRLVGNRLKYG
ncbi:MAG: adenylyltransferase/cytidyltransferase family protein [Candidatus Methanomethyliaceae archaeon]|nr:adenylyltransferase/cytidyltransferase family protein [Candidatus Methanomethyliaceae archaeon]